MNHLPIAPILLAAFGGFLLTLCAGRSLALQRTLSVGLAALGVVVAIASLTASLDGTPMVYALGDWPAPFGIVLVLDRLSALMVTLTSLVAFFSLLAAIRGWDAGGRLFHPLFQFQLMGLYGAFLTGDIFNLFVFFEVLLIASYGLLLHGQGPLRSRAGVKYVVVNLTGSALFLVAVGTLYGVTGTLNMADLAVKLPGIAPADYPWLRASAFLFLVVFGTKAALMPLSLWLPDAYSSTTPPVAALFAMMTKVGVYAIVRIYTLSFGAPESALGASMDGWLMAAALATLFFGVAAALQSRSLKRVVAYLGIGSIGTMLTGVAVFSPASIAASLFYMTQSSLTLAALFLLAGLIARRRGAEGGDRLDAEQRVAGGNVVGLLFLFAAIAMAGMPPLSGFLGKVLILQATFDQPTAWIIWLVILAASLMSVVTLSRAGSRLFWKSRTEAPVDPDAPPIGYLPVGGLALLMLGTAVFAGPLHTFTTATARDLVNPSAYVNAVLSNRTVVTNEG